MATIVTVHGTFAAGEKTGPSWWQEQSSFEIYIRRYVEAEDGSLSFVAHQWSGENKESARRKGGEELLEKILDIQKHDKAIAVLGHSHGGSVITNALMDSVVKNQDLTGLCRWITIGTPFITFDKKGVLLTRLPASEVYAMMVLAAATILLYLAFWASLDINAFLARIPFGPLDAYFFGSPKTEVIQQLQDGEAGRLLAHFRSAPDVFRTLSSLAALMLIFRVAEAYQRDRARHPQFAKGVEAKAGTRFGDKWLGLNHLLDEAVLMLTLLKSLRFGSIAFMAYFRGTPSGSLFTSSSRFNSNWGRHVLSSAAYYFVTILAPIIFVVWLTLVVSAAGVPVQLILRDPLSWFSEAADYYMNLEHAYLALKLLAILLAGGVVIAMVLLIVQIFFSVLLASAARVADTLVSAKLGNAALGVNTPGVLCLCETALDRPRLRAASGGV